ncbi:MAG: nitrilase-related carbon-nitrogen hydrolase [Gammaproteobacteria bacterium]
MNQRPRRACRPGAGSGSKALLPMYRRPTAAAEHRPGVTRRQFLAGLGAVALLPASRRAVAADASRYSALALQTRCDAVNQDATVEAARGRMMASIRRIAGQVASAKGFLKTFNGTDLRLVVLPEYYLTGFPLRETREEWKAKAAVDIGGPEYEALAGIADRYGVYLAGNLYENDPAFPGLYFQANTVIAPSGETILRYRRMISLYTPTPWDVWDAYLERYGADAIFPVARTEIGTLGTIASEEILYPEIARMTAVKGAELLLHHTSEVGSPLQTRKDVMKRARAIENMAYVISANTAGIAGTPIPADSADAMSKIVDWDGRVLAAAESGESVNANAIIDLPALRAARQRTGMANLLSRQPFGAYEDTYAGTDWAEPGAMTGGRMLSQAEVIARQRAVIERLRRDGVLR